MTRTALVTGAAGFLGTHLVRQLSEEGWDIVATDLQPHDREKYYPETDNPSRPRYDRSTVDDLDIDFVAADLTDPSTIGPLFEDRSIDVVFHAASLFDYSAEWDALEAVNVDGTRNVVEAAISHGIDHFVQFSTLGILEGADFDAPNDETAPVDPHNDYCRSKLQQEELLRERARSEGFPVTILRPGPIYGPGNRYGVYNIPLIIAKMGFAPLWRIYPRSRQLKFPSVHVYDLSRAALFAVDNPDETIGETYNVLSNCLDQDELIRICAEAVGVRTIRLPVPYPLYWLLSRYAQFHAGIIHSRAESRDLRPKVDAPMTQYLTQNMWFSNEKIRDIGFEFEYLDPRKGLWQYISWCKARGWLP